VLGAGARTGLAVVGARGDLALIDGAQHRALGDFIDLVELALACRICSGNERFGWRRCA
jgi:hypothetical protein